MFRNFLRVLLDQRGKNNIVEKQCCLLSDLKHALLEKYFLSAILKYRTFMTFLLNSTSFDNDRTWHFSWIFDLRFISDQKVFFFKNFDFNYIRYKNEIQDIKEKICSPFSKTVSHKMDFSTYGLHWDHPPAWELSVIIEIQKTIAWHIPAPHHKLFSRFPPYLAVSIRAKRGRRPGCSSAPSGGHEVNQKTPTRRPFPCIFEPRQTTWLLYHYNA